MIRVIAFIVLSGLFHLVIMLKSWSFVQCSVSSCDSIWLVVDKSMQFSFN